MEFIQTYAKELVSLLVPFIAWTLNSYGKSRAKVLVSQPHQFTFLVSTEVTDVDGNLIPQKQTVHTTSYLIQNAGKETANKLQLVFNRKPMYLNVWSPRPFTKEDLEDERHVLNFESLSPNEFFQCEVLSINQENPALLTVRCNECIGQFLPMYPQPFISSLKRKFIVIFITVGMAATAYITLLLIQFLVLKTPN
jgi:hypothetical protein